MNLLKEDQFNRTNYFIIKFNFRLQKMGYTFIKKSYFTIK